jgi:hypothetical protein
MLLEAMRHVDRDGNAMFEAHADLEIFRGGGLWYRRCISAISSTTVI